MKGKKLVLMFVAIIVALSAAVMVACPDEPERVPGPETGTYYYEVGGKEYTLMLMDVDQFVEVNGGEGIRTGTYVLNGSELTLTYPVSRDQSRKIRRRKRQHNVCSGRSGAYVFGVKEF